MPGGDPYDGTVYKHIYTLFPYQKNPTAAAALSLPMEITGTLHPLTFSPTGSVILDCRKSSFLKKVVFHYGTGSAVSKYMKNYIKATSQSLGLSYSQSLEPADYMDDEFISTNNQRYDGMSLTGAGVNITSPINAINQKPVVEVFSVNPNQLIFTDSPPEGNPGNLIVR